MGTGSVMRPGDVQVMSAGSGVAHSEYNHSKVSDVHFLQIWIVPSLTGGEPSYQQRHFSEGDKRGQVRLILWPYGSGQSLHFRPDVRVGAGLISGVDATRRY